MTITFKDGSKITASKDVLNELSTIYDSAARDTGLKGYYAIEKSYHDKAMHIYNELERVGFYDSVREI